MTGVNYSIYLHIPFCHHRCGYCDFNTYAGKEDLIERYVQALCREVELSATAAGEKLPVHTVFFGGGTPSLLSPAQLDVILNTVQRSFSVTPQVEITLEANPGTVSLGYLSGIRSVGINRLSLGMQSAQPEELRFLERQHDYIDVARAVAWARQAGFSEVNLDLIFGLPEQALSSWQHSLDLALRLKPDHFSLYSLTIEHGTPLAHYAMRGLISEPDSDIAAEMYEAASDQLASAGYEQYEISNWACKDGVGMVHACRHNLQYWRGMPYFGFGAGAHGYVFRTEEENGNGYGGVRTTNVLAPEAYLQRCLKGARQPFPRTPATASYEVVTRQAEIAETMMMGLRLIQEGVSSAAFLDRFGQSLQQVFGPQILRFVRQGLLEWAGSKDDPRLRLTKAGRLLGNQVFVEFI